MAAFNQILFNGASGLNEITRSTTITGSTYSVDSGSRPDYVIFCNRAGVITITLSAAAADGRMLMIKDISGAAATYNITIVHNASETIDGSNSYVMNVSYESICLIADASGNWWVV